MLVHESTISLRCTHCLQEKPLEDFYLESAGCPRRRQPCRPCTTIARRAYNKQWQSNHPDYQKQKYAADPARARANAQQWREANHEKELARYRRRRELYRDRINAQARQRHAANPKKRQAAQRQWRDANRERLRAQERQRRAKNRERRTARARQLYAANIEKVHAYQRQWRELHRENTRMGAKKYREAHPEYIKAWLKKNPEKLRAQEQRRRARKANAPINDFTAAQWTAMKAAYNYRCVYCPPTCWRCQRKQHALTMDHLTPLSKGGAHTYSNIVPSCRKHNSEKHTGPVLVPVQPVLLLAEQEKSHVMA